ncbi:C-type lectin domain family 10 member A-like [Ctenodactylus gundi]
MDKKYANLQDSGSEERNPDVKKDSKLQKDVVTLGTNFNNFTSDYKADIQELTSKNGELQGSIQFLKAEVEDHRHELQAGRALNQKVVSLESTLQQKEQEFKAGKSEVLLYIRQLTKDLRFLTCQLANLKSNDSEKVCCPLNWIEHEGSCYWFSHSEKSWPDADAYCQMEGAHLVVVNSLEEQSFIKDRADHENAWIGLTDQNGPWRWVDGTDYEKGFRNWAPKQPDNWEGHQLGGGEDCAHFTSDGRWNDNVCQRLYPWICELELSKAS